MGDLSKNQLSKFIPASLGRLEGTLEVLDLSYNKFEGTIPSQLGKLVGARISLNGNERIFTPAPLSLCSVPNCDVKDDTQLCPTERKALKEIYDLAKGREWTDSEHWTSEYKTYCDWHGVMCDETDQVI